MRRLIPLVHQLVRVLVVYPDAQPQLDINYKQSRATQLSKSLGLVLLLSVPPVS